MESAFRSDRAVAGEVIAGLFAGAALPKIFLFLLCT
jgi:hypothetical protein